MNGNNEIRVNQATMLEAVTLWLADQFKTPPRAVSVEKNSNEPDMRNGDTFIIKIQQTPSEPK